MIKKSCIVFFTALISAAMFNVYAADMGQNIIINNDYSNGLSGFTASSADISIDQKQMFQDMPSMRVVKTAVGGKVSTNLKLEKGVTYLFIANIKTESENSSFEYALYNPNTLKTDYLNNETIGNHWRTFKAQYTCDEDMEAELSIRVDKNGKKGEVYYINNMRCIAMNNSQGGGGEMFRSDIYVDGANGSDENTGSSDKPYKTIEKAKQTAAKSNSSMISDVTVHIKGGKYVLNEPIKFNTQDGAPSGFKIIYKPYDGEKVEISAKNGAFYGQSEGICINNIAFSDFEKPCISFENSNMICVEECSFENASAAAVDFPYSVTNAVVSKNSFKNINAEAVIIGRNDEKAASEAKENIRAVSGNKISENNFYNCGTAIKLGYQANSVIDGNSIEKSKEAIYIGGEVSGLEIRKNDIKECINGIITDEANGSECSISYNFINCSGGTAVKNSKGFNISDNVIEGSCIDIGSDNEIIKDGKLTSRAVDILEAAGIKIFQYPKVNFKDIENHWAKDDIERAANLGYIKGRSEEEFSPDDDITREEFILMVSRVLGENIFEGMFGDDKKPIIRKEIAAVVKKSMEFMNIKYENNEELVFNDIYDVIPDDIMSAASAGIMQGDDNGNFRMDDTATRAEAAVILCRIRDKMDSDDK